VGCSPSGKHAHLAPTNGKGSQQDDRFGYSYQGTPSQAAEKGLAGKQNRKGTTLAGTKLCNRVAPEVSLIGDKRHCPQA
jgi:hypothetical protein